VPVLAMPTMFTFRVTVTDGRGGMATRDVMVQLAPATKEDVNNLFTARCDTCHRPSSSPWRGTSAADMRTKTVGIASSKPMSCTVRTLVVAGMPSQSLVFRKVAGTQAMNTGMGCGQQMPTMTLMPAAEQAIVESWIAAGAL
jgi:hypothetical protein